ncbi:hypothetical protein JQK62_23440, partial [Leptospira santarosai]|nr:hypothetical protein [Leptospira santarosai]
MKNAVNARGFILEFLSTSCAITHGISNNGTGLSILEITCTSQLTRHSFFSNFTRKDCLLFRQSFFVRKSRSKNEWLPADFERKRKIMICTIQEISKMLGGNIIFEEISLAVKTGDKLAVVGRNGTGKT